MKRIFVFFVYLFNEMTIFKTGRPGQIRFILKNCAITLCVFAVTITVLKLFFSARFHNSAYFIAGGILLARTIDELLTNRLHEIAFDKEKKQIVFHFRNMFSGLLYKTLSFDDARLEVAGKERSPTLYFLKNKTEVFKVNKYKDGFSNDDLQKMSEAFTLFIHSK